jgi:peptide/nickel transport system substrate-binding protein
LSAERCGSGRRELLKWTASWAALEAFSPPRAFAAGRRPVGGKLALRIPWPLASLDPHRIDDASAAILGAGLFDTLYATDDTNVYAPSLAESDPETMGSRLRVTLRAGIRSAFGRPIEAKDALFSLQRAAASGASAWLAEIGLPRVESPATLSFAARDVAKLKLALASPLTAVVPAGFSPERPDGTGPFRADREGVDLVLRRNENAASGPAFLDEIRVRPAIDLADSLAAFESGSDDLGWLGSGLHEPRPGARVFDAGACGWAVLRTGAAAGAWDAPGVAQRICDGIPPARLSYLALGPMGSSEPDEGWGGPVCDLLVREDAPWLRELARAVAAAVSRPSHEVTAKPVPAAEIVARRASRAYALALDVARPLGRSALGALLGLTTSDDPARAIDVMRHPPRSEAPVRTSCRTLRIGVLGEIRIQGAQMPDVALAFAPGSIDFGSITRSRSGTP